MKPILKQSSPSSILSKPTELPLTEVSRVTVLVDVASIPSVILKHSDISTIRNLLGTRLDVAGTLWRHRTFYDDRLVHEHEKWVSSPTPHRGEVGAEARLTSLQVP